jgi:hypothetical protein
MHKPVAAWAAVAAFTTASVQMFNSRNAREAWLAGAARTDHSEGFESAATDLDFADGNTADGIAGSSMPFAVM